MASAQVALPQAKHTQSKAVEESENNSAVELLSSSFVQTFEGPLEIISKRLQELSLNSEALLSKIQAEQNRLRTIPFLDSIIQTMSLVGTYHQKIVSIRKQMSSLSERVAKLKKRTDKLHQKKVNEQLAAAEKKEKELERERQLTAKPAKELLLQDPANALAASSVPPVGATSSAVSNRRPSNAADTVPPQSAVQAQQQVDNNSSGGITATATNAAQSVSQKMQSVFTFAFGKSPKTTPSSTQPSQEP